MSTPSHNDRMELEIFDSFSKTVMRNTGRNIAVSAHPFCQPKGSELCHAGTSSVKAKTLYFVKADHLICRGCKCSRENKSDKPIMRHA